MSIYDEMQVVASDLLTEFQQGVIKYIQVVPGNGPVHNPGPSTQVPHVINSTARGVSSKYVDGTLVVATDLQVVAPVIPGVMYEQNGKVSIDDVMHKIVQIHKKPAAGTMVAAVLIIRKGG